ncbi:MAG: murein biosynthesis integral membrane protein MurJ [Anaerolineae bacterium]
MSSDPPTLISSEGQGIPEASAPTTQGAVARGVAASAVIVGVGQLLSRLMGFLREMVIAGIFGSSAAVSSFAIASAVPQMVYDLLLGGMVSAALVPVLSEYAGRGDRDELGRVTSTLLTVGITVFLGIVLILELLAPVLAMVLGGGFALPLRQLTTLLIRLILPSLVFFCAWGIAAAVLYARQQFVFPALASAVYNLGVILAALFLASRFQIAALSLGVVLGALLQLLIVLPGLRGLPLRVRFDLRHPALRRIVLLYLPVIASLIVANLGIVIDRNLASRTVDQAIAWMKYATFLVQLPLGLVSVAIATATLPALARLSSPDDVARFRRTLAGALRLVLVLILPATVAILVLGQEAIRAALEHGAFTSFDTAQVTRALLFYLPGLPFAAIDQPLVFAFYARKDTITPVWVGIAGVGAYLAVGPLLAFGLGLGFIGLVIANAMQLISHCIIMWVMLQRRVGTMAGLGLLHTASRAAVASGLAGLGMLAGMVGARALFPGPGTVPAAVSLAGGGALGLTVYVAALAGLQVEELTIFLSMARNRLRRPA